MEYPEDNLTDDAIVSDGGMLVAGQGTKVAWSGHGLAMFHKRIQ